MFRWTTFILAAVLLLGCRDKHKMAADKIGPAIERLFPLFERDTKQVRGGIAKGAQILGLHVDDDPGADPEGIRRAIRRGRAGVNQLQFAKSTFFIFVTPDGVIQRSESDPDLAAGASLIKAVPAAKKMLVADAGVTELFGHVPGLRGAEKGVDVQWLVGHPVKNTKGTFVGVFVTGWSLRLYAQYLENDTRTHFTATSTDKTRPIPLVYVFLLKDDHAYGARVTPQENADAVVKLGIHAKLSGGAFTGDLVVDGRKFALAAKSAPKLGPGIVVVLLMSEF